MVNKYDDEDDEDFDYQEPEFTKSMGMTSGDEDYRDVDFTPKVKGNSIILTCTTDITSKTNMHSAYGSIIITKETNNRISFRVIGSNFDNMFGNKPILILRPSLDSSGKVSKDTVINGVKFKKGTPRKFSSTKMFYRQLKRTIEEVYKYDGREKYFPVTKKNITISQDINQEVSSFDVGVSLELVSANWSYRDSKGEICFMINMDSVDSELQIDQTFIAMIYEEEIPIVANFFGIELPKNIPNPGVKPKLNPVVYKQVETLSKFNIATAENYLKKMLKK